MVSHTRKNPADRNLGMRIELCRRRKKLSQDQLGAELGVTGPAVCHWETGRHEPPRDKMIPLAKALGASVGWLSGESVSDAETDFEELYLRLLLDGGEELEQLLRRFPSVESLIQYLAAYIPPPES